MGLRIKDTLSPFLTKLFENIIVLNKSKKPFFVMLFIPPLNATPEEYKRASIGCKSCPEILDADDFMIWLEEASIEQLERFSKREIT